MTDKTKAKSGGLAQRLLTAVVAVPILLWVILEGPAWSWLIVVIIATAVGLYEFTAMTVGRKDAPVGAMAVGLGTLLVPTIYFAPTPTLAFTALSVVVLALVVTTLIATNDVDTAAQAMTGALASILYVALFLTLLALLRKAPAADEGRYWVLMVLAVTWGGDTGAYFAGRAFGRHKLAPAVSPKKTWEGALGGALVSVGAGFLVVQLTPLEIRPLLIVLLTLPAAVLGQIGDLCESLIKRSVGVKDSGVLIYGHGGILDRIDGVLFAGAYFYLFYSFTFGAVGVPIAS